MTAIMLGQSAVAAAGVTLNLNPHIITDIRVDPSNASAGINFLANGTITFTGNSTPTSPDIDEWVKEQVGFASGAQYEVAYTALVGGTAPTTLAAAEDTFVALSSTRTWSLERGVLGTFSGTYTFVVREIANTANSVTANMTVTATVETGV